jgi:hypothetical protein
LKAEKFHKLFESHGKELLQAEGFAYKDKAWYLVTDSFLLRYMAADTKFGLSFATKYLTRLSRARSTAIPAVRFSGGKRFE